MVSGQFPCPICDGLTGRLFSKHGYWIRGCDLCRHQCAEITLATDHVDRVYDDRYFQGGEAGYSDYLSEATMLRAHGRRYGQLLCPYMGTGTVLDVGAAAGLILQGFLDAGWKGMGIEPNARMAHYARTRLGLLVETCPLEQFRSSHLYDLVSMIQVVAHFVDPRKALQVAAEVTRPRGFWLIETWNRESWTARIFGKRWHEYSPPSVLHWFSPEGLRRLAGQFGFCEVARGRPAKWVNGGHVKSLLRHQLKGCRLERLATAMVSVIPTPLPIPYVADDVFWVLFQKS